MPTHDPAASARPEPPPRTGTVYGVGGAPVAPGAAPVPRWLMPGAVAIGGLGVVVGLLFALGLTPFGPDEAGTPAAPPLAGTTEPAGAAAGAASPSPTTAPTPTPTPDPGTPRGALRSVASSLCLQPAPDEDPQGAHVQQVPCSGAPAQQWRAAPAEGDLFTIVNAESELCLDVNDSSKDDGASVLQWPCHGRDNQQWRVAPVGGSVTLVSRTSDKCLDVPGARPDPELDMQQYTCNGTPAQQWVWVP
ncbi:MAG TPA: RICIN domain-containing protein [Pilimelia sp.]|nr:RICIN domain-containing protein [Pilimelia sp.]